MDSYPARADVIHAARDFNDIDHITARTAFASINDVDNAGPEDLPHYFKAYEAICRRGIVDSWSSNSATYRCLRGRHEISKRQVTFSKQIGLD
jgi:hypothetical protein